MAKNDTSGSICLKRTRKRLANLLWGALFLFAALAMLTYAVYNRTPDRSGWEETDWFTYILSITLGLAALAAGLYESFIAVRDAFFPEKSRLAKSIRSQLPYPDETLSARELFAKVDKDIGENGLWFDRIAVGKEWLLGDDVTYIPRIRAVFGRDEIKRRRVNGRNITGEVIQLYIIDDRKQIQVTGLRNPDELKAVLECLKLRVPDALFLPYEKYPEYAAKSKDEWYQIDREFRIRKANREMNAPEPKISEEQNMIFTGLDGTDTSRVTEDMITAALYDAVRTEEEALFTLTPTIPIEAGGRTLSFLQCGVLGIDDPELSEEELREEAEIYLFTAVTPENGRTPEYGFVLQCSYDEAKRILLDWFHGKAPDVSDWLPINIASWQPPQQAKAKPPKLILESASGVFQSYENFGREDVEIAAKGLRDGTYKLADLTLPGGYLTFRVEVGDKTDGRCKLNATSDADGTLRFYTLKCSEGQAAEWLLKYYDGGFRPAKPEWKDITKRVYRKIGV